MVEWEGGCVVEWEGGSVRGLVPITIIFQLLLTYFIEPVNCFIALTAGPEFVFYNIDDRGETNNLTSSLIL